MVVYCDLHGHSKKHNVFIYGCDDLADPALRLRARVFPFMLSKNAPSKFSYRDSKFGVQKSKVGVPFYSRNSSSGILMILKP